jgi:alpha 1,3-glucosidase
MPYINPLIIGVFIALTAAHTQEVPPSYRPAGGTVSAEEYPNGVIRLRIRPGSDIEPPYEVLNVIVAEPSTNTPPVTPSSEGFTLETSARTSLEVRTTDMSVTYKANGGVKATATLPAHGGSRVEGTFRFPSATHVYGIPERAVDFALKDTSYRLYNLDVFQYKLDDTGGVYGTIPFLMAYGPEGTTGVLWLNGADTTVTVSSSGGWTSSASKEVKWDSESGIHDVFFFPGPTPKDVMRQQAEITGKAYLPPYFSLGYHQCRWNYRSEEDSLQVDEGFDTHNIPYDVLWLDIEHTDGKKYFTWDRHNFPNPKQMQDTIAAKGRKMVTITDPHIKRESGYHVHDEASREGYYVKKEDGGDYEGHCWPGTSSWLDFFNPRVRSWYATLFLYNKYQDSTPNLYTWIDMNEPSVFNSHEVTMDKNAVHTIEGGRKYKHRDVHNLYGYYHTMAAYEGHILRSSQPPHSPTRPFILTRSFFAGTQRYAAVWTGDNAANWEHLAKSIPMLLAMSVANLPFVGADVGGFFGNPEGDLMVRWYQVGAFYPFFRGHAHLETKRREPWLFGPETTRHIRKAINNRYVFLPYIYTTFYRTHTEGIPVIRPLIMEFPTEPAFAAEQNSFLVGDAVLVCPVLGKDITSVACPLPTSSNWYDYYTGRPLSGTPTLEAPLNHVPVLLRGGRIIPTRQRLRRSSAATYNDPFTLYVALGDRVPTATGEVYLDDYHSFDYQQGAFQLRAFKFEGDRLSCDAVSTAIPQNKVFTSSVKVERVIVYGAPKGVKKVTLAYRGASAQAGDVSLRRQVDFAYLGEALVVRKVDASVVMDWDLSFEN